MNVQIQPAFNLAETLKQAEKKKDGVNHKGEQNTKYLWKIPYIVMLQRMKDAQGVEFEQQVSSEVFFVGKSHVITNKEGHTMRVRCFDDNNCPYCERQRDSIAIVNYRKDLERLTRFGYTGANEQLDRQIKAILDSFYSERKIKEKETRYYLVVAEFKYTSPNVYGVANLVRNENNVPIYAIKVVELAEKALTDILEDVRRVTQNQGNLMNSEIEVFYPDERNIRDRYKNRKFTCLTAKELEATYPALVQKINAEVAEFQAQGFPYVTESFSGLAPENKEDVVNKLNTIFAEWDNFKKEREVNPNAQYLEYTNQAPTVPLVPQGNSAYLQGGMQFTPPPVSAVATQPTYPSMQTGYPNQQVVNQQMANQPVANMGYQNQQVVNAGVQLPNGEVVAAGQQMGQMAGQVVGQQMGQMTGQVVQTTGQATVNPAGVQTTIPTTPSQPVVNTAGTVTTGYATLEGNPGAEAFGVGTPPPGIPRV